MKWNLRYASHLGYRDPLRGLYAASAGSDDPVAQIDFAAALGFAGVQVARAVDWTNAERAAIRKALERHGLETGCMVYAGREIALAPLWADTGAASRATREDALAATFAVAREINARHAIVFSGADPRIPLALQQAILRTVHELGYSGLVELEHDWSTPTRESEARGLAVLQALDARLANSAA